MRSASLLVFALALTVPAQPMPVTPTALFASPGSQVNTLAATLVGGGTFQAPGHLPSPNQTILGPGSLSSTMCHESFGSTTYPAPGAWSLTGQVIGVPGSPIAVGVEVMPGSFICGGFAGWPCMTGPLLFASTPTTFGTLHLTASRQVILDGIWNTAPPANLGANGTFPLAGTGVIDTTTNGGLEYHFAVQAAVANPTVPGGVALTACMTASQWVFWL